MATREDLSVPTSACQYQSVPMADLVKNARIQ